MFLLKTSGKLQIIFKQGRQMNSVKELEKDYVQGLSDEEITILQDIESGKYKSASKKTEETFKNIIKVNIEKKQYI